MQQYTKRITNVKKRLCNQIQRYIEKCVRQTKSMTTNQMAKVSLCRNQD
jgi:hypothetical protein